MDIKIVPLRELLSEIIYSHADPGNPDYNECDIDLCGWCWSAKAHIAEMPTDKKSLTVQGDEP